IDWWRFIRDKKIGINNSQCGFIETYYRGFADDNIYSGRLYLAVKLLKPLEAGKKYYFEMMVRAVDTFPNYKLVNTVFTDGQDVSFTKDLPLFDFIIPRNFLALKPVVRTVLQKSYEWHKVKQCFIADGTEHYLVIGNFRDDANTETASTGKSNINFPSGLIANYAIDNVVLTSMEIPLGDSTLCKDDTLKFNVGKPILPDLKYLWQNGTTIPTYLATQSERVSIRMEYAPQCIAEKQFNVIELTKANSSLQGIDTTICEGQTVQIQGGIHVSGQTIQWEDGSNAPVRNINVPGIFTATIRNTCGIIISQKFNVDITVCNTGIFIPNLFTPNGDGINDEFKPIFATDFPEIESYTLSIFSRWGELVFISRNIEIGWHGEHASGKAAEGVYIYSITIKTASSGPGNMTRNGDITLIQN
ncbi:MAG: gliding motility-associated C-terminal domain-containing protein, partial [Saprospiraceae bacterium]